MTGRHPLCWQDSGMDELPNAADVAERLRTTVLRGFGPDNEEIPWGGQAARITISIEDCPLPSVLRLTLSLIDLEVHGPAEKVAWWVLFAFDGHRFELAHQKFGLRLLLMSEGLEVEQATRVLRKAQKKLLSALRVVEQAINAASKGILDSGDATVRNQHSRLEAAYDYFRERATNPAHVEDIRTSYDSSYVPGMQVLSFRSGRAVMERNATHDMVAAVTAYVSRLEHDLVLALPFVGFDASEERLTEFIGSRWGLKYERVLGRSGDAKTYLNRLAAVVERWRNPYAHGGFEKGHNSTVFVHVPGAGALPIGLTAMRSRPYFSLSTATTPNIEDVFALFDEFDGWFSSAHPHASRWIESGLDVRFDASFCAKLQSVADDDDAFHTFLDYTDYQQERHDNMDY